MSVRHFRSLLDLNSQELRQILARASELKKMLAEGVAHEFLKNKSLAMIFEKSSTRTRVSFEAGMTQFGGSSIFLSPADSQLGRGEPIPDTARVLSRMVDAIMVRTFSHDTVETLAEHSSVPVINGLTDSFHPCQLLADLQTYFEHRGDIQGKTVSWIGDGNNMCNSYINAAELLDFELLIACPPGYEPMQSLLDDNKDRVRLLRDPKQAVAGSSLVATDVWASMGQEDELQKRLLDFADFEVTPELMSYANNDAIFLHCLPAHRGEEVSAEVIDAPASLVWEEAENRLHAQKALLEFLLCS
ncbi:MAG: ornithine carbamoyltransferase [SAR86 cluster bacterium]|uniref:Ornithine carbamoyltransferase n=1 Tax=SAR86 cluster bacterium TaxID=2030880 RepID=A0A2A5C6S2_9GAMM|nr:MAG: ornithine carbamoyltransferase [SAR86 cluster bacterium]